MTDLATLGTATHAMERPLELGNPITYWQLGDTFQARFDVPDCPMPGEMDPFFFLTKDKNFIPHRYPCRTRWIEQKRNRRPQVERAFSARRLWLPFGASRVDLSGFWFRPTRLGTWSEATLFAARAGKARFRLSTCGGAIAYVNGSEVAWTAHYERNFETGIEFEVELNRGPNLVHVYFDDLAERDTRYYFQLDYLGGPELRAILPANIDKGAFARVEEMLEGAHFSQPSYTDGPVVLKLPRAAPFDIEVEVRIEGDFMSLESERRGIALAAGDTELVIADVKELPADFRHFHLSLQLWGLKVERAFGVEICHTARQGPAPEHLAERIAEALTYTSAHSEADTVSALARLASGHSGAKTEAMIEAVLPAIEDCYDCADFVLVPLIWCRIRFADALSRPLRTRIDAAILGFRYWLDEPGNDVQWFFSENHALLFHTAAYLAGCAFPEHVFTRSGRTGREQAAVGKARVAAWLDHFNQWEMAEFNSAPYFPIDLKGLTALFALAEDADIRHAAAAAIGRLITIIAQSSHHGQLTGAQARSYEHTLRAACSLELSGLARLLWGRGHYGRRVHALPQVAICVRDHGLKIDPKLQEIADFTGGGGREWRFAQGPEAFAKLYHYKTAAHALGTAANYRWNEWGYQETVVHARLGNNPNAQIWINHPGEVIHSGFGRPSYWGGSGRLPRVHQYRSLALLQFEPLPEQVNFTHAWFPQQLFDEVLIRPGFAAARSGEALALLVANQPLHRVDRGPSAGCELRAYGQSTRWLLRLAHKDRHPSLEEFALAYSHEQWLQTDTGDWVFEDPDYGAVVMNRNGEVRAQGRTLDPGSWTIAGASEVLDEPGSDTASRESWL